MVIMAILSICRIIFHGLRPLALYFWHGLMKKYFSFLLKVSTNWGSACDLSVLLHSKLLFEALHEKGSPSVICANSLSSEHQTDSALTTDRAFLHLRNWSCCLAVFKLAEPELIFKLSYLSVLIKVKIR